MRFCRWPCVWRWTDPGCDSPNWGNRPTWQKAQRRQRGYSQFLGVSVAFRSAKGSFATAKADAKPLAAAPGGSVFVAFRSAKGSVISQSDGRHRDLAGAGRRRPSSLAYPLPAQRPVPGFVEQFARSLSAHNPALKTRSLPAAPASPSRSSKASIAAKVGTARVLVPADCPIWITGPGVGKTTTFLPPLMKRP
jgi:hypothetical protein